jgi:hypothetical protein
MARNYIQDITPQDSNEESEGMPPERSIRSLRPSAARVRLSPQRPLERPERDEEAGAHPPRRRSRTGVWIASGIAFVALVAAGVFVVLPSTNVTVIPRAHVMPFDTSMPFTAYPAESAAPGTIPYTVATQVFEESAVVQASGTEHAEEKATGSVTVYNEHSDQPVRLIKNTRFQAPNGQIFRIPVSVDVPGKKGATPGSIAVTVFADQTGPDYNIGPIDRFTLPGLKSSPDMYEKVYAKSTAAFTGGFSGERPAVSASVLESSRAELRNRLTEKAMALPSTAPSEVVAFPGLLAVSFETLPPTTESGGGVRIHERATVTMPVFPAAQFASSIAQAVSADATGNIGIKFSADTTGAPVGTIEVADLGKQPLTFTLNGRGQLIWNVDSVALAGALAGREEAAFETIVDGFPEIEEARARLTPFWANSFPGDAEKISVSVENPPAEF